jgi:hypothetical protein
MGNFCKLNSLSSLSFIIIGVFLYITSDGHQSFSAQDGEEETYINNNEELTNNDIFSDLSRNLPNIDKNVLNGDSDKETDIVNEDREDSGGNVETSSSSSNKEVSNNEDNNKKNKK